MDPSPTMDKKAHSRPPPLCKNNQEPTKSGFDYSAKKNGSQYPRKRENEKSDNGKRSSNRGGRAGQRYVRSREKVGCQVDLQESSEIGSVQRSGSKKQNITHLLNWWGPGPERHSNRGFSDYGGIRGSRGRVHNYHSKYNKEHFLQANCQFVVSAGHDYTAYEKDPDHLVAWEFVEEVRLHVSESPACPICLHPPVAAKISRCGHIFCFPCILHYLALTDEKWRKCPICFDAVTKEDLKSVVTILHKDLKANQEVELTLMRREKDSLVPIPVSCFSEIQSGMATLSSSKPVLSNSKLIVASKDEVSKIIVGREMEDLNFQLAVEGNQPEACFIQEALSLVSYRNTLLSTPSKSLPSLSEEATASDPCTERKGLSLEDLHLDDLAEESPPPKQLDLDRALANSARVFQESSLIMPDDFGVNPLPGIAPALNLDSKGTSKSSVYFYQENNGAHVYLHSLNVQMLLKEYGSLENCPPTIKAKVLEKESDTMTESLRQRFRYLRHLPISCPFEVVEVDIKPPLVSLLTIADFQTRLDQREKKRKKRAKEEHRIEKRVQVEEDRMMGRSRGANINMTSFRHFPTFTEELPSASPVPNIVAEEEAYSSPSVGSFSDDIVDASTPSFAQMIRCGSKKQPEPATQFPSLGSSNFAHRLTPSVHEIKKGPSKNIDVVDSDGEDAEKVPDFSTAFSDAFAKALDQAAARRISDSASADDNSPRGKKGKKKKGIVLLSSGGR